jgi:hypothetical protein
MLQSFHQPHDRLREMMKRPLNVMVLFREAFRVRTACSPCAGVLASLFGGRPVH